MPILGELELAYRTMTAEFVAITGTNGKTTTTALTGALLAESGRPVLVGGNIGRPLTAEALTFPADGMGRRRGLELPAGDGRTPSGRTWRRCST